MPLLTVRVALVLLISAVVGIIVFALSYIATSRNGAAAGLAALGAAGATLVALPGLLGS